MNHQQERDSLSQSLLEKTRSILDAGPIDRATLKIENAVTTLSDRVELWGKKISHPHPLRKNKIAS